MAAISGFSQLQPMPLTPTATTTALRSSQSVSTPMELVASQRQLGPTVVQQGRQASPMASTVETVPVGYLMPDTVSSHSGTMRTQSPAVSYRTSSPMQAMAEPYVVREAGVVGSSFLQAEITNLSRLYQEEKAHRIRLEAEVAAMKARLDKIDPPETPFMAAVRQIERRGNLRVDHQTGHVQLIHQINFVPRSQKNDREPTAVFRDVAQAEEICRDLAEISNLFGVGMTIEGHTKGGEGEYWQTLANDRARIVAQKCIEFGANENMLQIQGRPGRSGKNEVRTEVYLDVKADRVVHDKLAVAEAQERAPSSPKVIRASSNGLIVGSLTRPAVVLGERMIGGTIP